VLCQYVKKSIVCLIEQYAVRVVPIVPTVGRRKIYYQIRV